MPPYAKQLNRKKPYRPGLKMGSQGQIVQDRNGGRVAKRSGDYANRVGAFSNGVPKLPQSAFKRSPGLPLKPGPGANKKATVRPLGTPAPIGGGGGMPRVPRPQEIFRNQRRNRKRKRHGLPPLSIDG